MVVEKAYAKLNLSLNVLEKRVDGFHNLETIMVPVSDLFDILEFNLRDDESFSVLGMEMENNIIIKAAKLFQQKYQTKGADIKVVKNIPIEAGLAGGSADASATLRGLNKLFNINAPLAELEELALMLGSDTVFCLYNKAAVCKGRGEILEFIDFDFSLPVWVLKPSFGLLTKDVFSKLKIGNISIRTKDILLSLKENNIDVLNKLISNDLFIPATIVNSKIKDIISALEKNNIKGHMSGSGSTIYIINNLFSNYNDILKAILRENKIEYAYLKEHLIKSAVNDCK